MLTPENFVACTYMPAFRIRRGMSTFRDGVIMSNKRYALVVRLWQVKSDCTQPVTTNQLDSTLNPDLTEPAHCHHMAETWPFYNYNPVEEWPGGDYGPFQRGEDNLGVLTTVNTRAVFIAVYHDRPQTAWPAVDSVLDPQSTLLLRWIGVAPEEGGLNNAAHTWQLDGAMLASGKETNVQGVAPDGHVVELTAQDSLSHGDATVTVTVAPLNVPLSAETPTLDGRCDDNSYGATALIPLAAYSSGEQANVRLVRTNDQLWVCCSGLLTDTGAINSIANLWSNVDHSGGNTVQAADLHNAVPAADLHVALDDRFPPPISTPPRCKFRLPPTSVTQKLFLPLVQR